MHASQLLVMPAFASAAYGQGCVDTQRRPTTVLRHSLNAYNSGLFYPCSLLISVVVPWDCSHHSVILDLRISFLYLKSLPKRVQLDAARPRPAINMYYYQSQASILSVAIALPLLDTLAVLLRFCVRRKQRQPLLADDWLTLPALVSQFLFIIIKYS